VAGTGGILPSLQVGDNSRQGTVNTTLLPTTSFPVGLFVVLAPSHIAGILRHGVSNVASQAAIKQLPSQTGDKQSAQSDSRSEICDGVYFNRMFTHLQPMSEANGQLCRWICEPSRRRRRSTCNFERSKQLCVTRLLLIASHVTHILWLCYVWLVNFCSAITTAIVTKILE